MTNYGVDKNGFIITEVGLDKIKPTFKKIINKIHLEVVTKFGDKIHSLYLYGSVATGKARVKLSDLDLLLILNQKPTTKIKNEIKELHDYLSNEYLNIFRGVGISVTHTGEVKDDTYGWGCFIKHLCVCLYGPNLGEGFKNFKPTKIVAKALNGDVDNNIKSVLKSLRVAANSNEIHTLCRSVMRKIVRTGFSLVMEKEHSWTTDLKKSYEVFAKYYPAQSANMKKAFALSQKPTSNIKIIEEFLENFGSWISSEVKKQF